MQVMLNHQTFFDEATSTATYLVWDGETKAAAVVDPVLDFDPKAGKLSHASADAVLAAIREAGLVLTYVLETHAHADHLSAADYIRRKTGARVVIGAEITRVQKTFIPMFEADDVTPDGRAFDLLVEEGAELPLGRLKIGVLHTPGHTPACVTYLIGDAAFVGDTLFMPDYGTARADFPGGDAATLYRSIRRILALPPQTRIFVGHDYLPAGRSDFRWETTVAEQRAQYPHPRRDQRGRLRSAAKGAGRDPSRAHPAPPLAAGEHPRRRVAARVKGRPCLSEAAGDQRLKVRPHR